jgi:NADH-quinone oxidoreductase subunit J
MSSTLFTAEGLGGVLFLIGIIVTMAGALIAISASQLIRAVSGLALSFLGVASIYYYLNSPFIALMQILIYVGGISVLIIFAIMLAEPAGIKLKEKRNTLRGLFSLISAGILTWGLASLGTDTDWQVFARVDDGSVKDIGTALLTTYSMSFELISLLLVTAIIGAIVLSRAGRSGGE